VAASGQFAANGFMWIPVRPQHPVLAQIFIDWRLSNDAQFPDLESGGSPRAPGPSSRRATWRVYVGLEPEWIADNYATSTRRSSSSRQLQVDRLGLLRRQLGDWYDYWLERLGL
jgi:ABC-type uncharacterized transport system YnjBCD substrate-binding protein